MNPMVDGWKGDDWFHNGAFREQNMSYIYEQDGKTVELIFVGDKLASGDGAIKGSFGK